MINRLTSQ